MDGRGEMTNLGSSSSSSSSNSSSGGGSGRDSGSDSDSDSDCGRSRDSLPLFLSRKLVRSAGYCGVVRPDRSGRS